MQQKGLAQVLAEEALAASNLALAHSGDAASEKHFATQLQVNSVCVYVCLCVCVCVFVCVYMREIVFLYCNMVVFILLYCHMVVFIFSSCFVCECLAYACT